MAAITKMEATAKLCCPSFLVIFTIIVVFTIFAIVALYQGGPSSSLCRPLFIVQACGPEPARIKSWCSSLGIGL